MENKPVKNYDKIIEAILCYIATWPGGIIMLVLKPDNRNIRFHAMQSIILFGSLMVGALLFWWIPVLGNFIGSFFGLITGIFWVILLIKSMMGEVYKAPIAGKLAETFAGKGRD